MGGRRRAPIAWYMAIAAAPGLLLLRGAAAQLLPGQLESVVLSPSSPYQVRVGVGQAKFMGFSCMGGPADVVISLSTYAENADPLLFLSLNPDASPSLQQHDASSFGQWQEDASGDHYVIAKAVGPRGGILGLLNMRHFASEELDGILSIHCTFIIAFDTLFWDHLRSSEICPVGSRQQDGQALRSENFCSGHGQCGKHGLCQCDGDFAGPACEHPKSDQVVAADGHYKFQVATGRYQYFRVRVPPRFPGGYLEVKVWSEQPLVVLIRGDDLPTKSQYELSNFDDWVNQRYVSVLKYKVAPSEEASVLLPQPDNFPTAMGGPTPSLGSALPPRQLSRGDAGEVRGWSDLFLQLGAGFNSTVVEEGWLGSSPRGLQEQDCPPTPAFTDPACQTQVFGNCQASCEQCMVCVKGGGRDGSGDRGCSDSCNACVSQTCVSTLQQCAGDLSCTGSEAQRCEAGCGNCMACFDSNDERCTKCKCCIGCLPLAAKCSIAQQALGGEVTRFAFIGVYNHRRYYNDREVIHAAADIKLTEDPDFDRENLPTSWLADLYNPFHDIRTVEITQQQVYPDGQQFLYAPQPIKPGNALRMEVRLYKERMTLLRLVSAEPAVAGQLLLEFAAGANITHILCSSRAVPKTLFDFDQVHEQVASQVKVDLKGQQGVWCSLFGGANGYVQLTAQLYEESAQSPAIGFALVCVFGLLCALVVLGVIYGGAQKIGEFMGMDPNIPLMERLGCLVRNTNPHESTASLTRTGSLTGYIGSDVIDRSVEDQYLHRGGAGDDGI